MYLVAKVDLPLDKASFFLVHFLAGFATVAGVGTGAAVAKGQAMSLSWMSISKF